MTRQGDAEAVPKAILEFEELWNLFHLVGVMAVAIV